MVNEEYYDDNKWFRRKDNYEAVLKEFHREQESREDIYRECKAIDRELSESLGYCQESEILEEELAEFKRQNDIELADMEAHLKSLKTSVR